MILTIIASLSLNAHAFDHAHTELESVLQGSVRSGGVDYTALKGHEQRLDTYVAALAGAPVSTFNPQDQMAFWLNAYNAITLSVVLDELPLKSIRDLDGGKLWDKRTFTVAAETLTLNDISHHKLHPAQDPRVHAAINCASASCPPLPASAFVGAQLNTQLDAAARAWIQSNAYRITDNAIALSPIFEWYAADFATRNKGDIAGVDGAAESALWFISAYDKSPILTSGTLRASFITYDWSLNSQ